MKTQILKPDLSAAIGLFLTAPTACFILISFLKYVLGLPALFDAAAPILEAGGIKETIGWNSNLLLLLGPLVALLLNLGAVLELNWNVTLYEANIHLTFHRHIKNWLVIGLSGLCLLTLFVYAIGENCSC